MNASTTACVVTGRWWRSEIAQNVLPPTLLEGAKAQLSQIELRKTMCRFVESYAEFAKRIKTDNAETLGKFENMIFSNIVGSDEKLPATFDGVEQLSTLIKAVKS